jgi:NhaP-type Na+/H+ or K+/H+ antiporter
MQTFIAWFGPRGIATMALLLIAVVQLSDQHGQGSILESPYLSTGLDADLVGPVLLTVVLSVFAHGVSEAPLVDYLARDRERRGRGHDQQLAAAGSADPTGGETASLLPKPSVQWALFTQGTRG